MLKRVYASNYRTLINFNIDLRPLTLLLGPNGAGKTTILDVVRLVRDFLRGEPVRSDGKVLSPTTMELFPIQHELGGKTWRCSPSRSR